MKRTLLELGKDIAIALLAIVALILLLLCNLRSSMLETPVLGRLLEPAAKLLHIEHAELPPLAPEQTSAAEAARPVAISIRNESGRSSAMGGSDTLETVYLQLGAMLGEALDTADEGVAVSEADYLRALGEPGVCFLYQTSMPVGTLGSWLGASTALDGEAATQLLLCLSGGRVQLYLAGLDGYLCTETQARAAALRSLLEPFLPDGSAFAFETDDPACARLAPLTLLPLQTSPVLHALDAAAPAGSSFSTQILTSLGINAYGANAYQDASGAALYNEAGFSLRIGADGAVELRNSDSRLSADAASLTARIELARALLDAMTDGQTGAGRLQLSGWEQDGNGTLCVTFDYFVTGIPVALPGHAATVTFRGAQLDTLQLTARCYTVQNARLPLLPVRQAAALVPAGGSLLLCYADNGGEITGGWRS